MPKQNSMVLRICQGLANGWAAGSENAPGRGRGSGFGDLDGAGVGVDVEGAGAADGADGEGEGFVLDGVVVGLDGIEEGLIGGDGEGDAVGDVEAFGFALVLDAVDEFAGEAFLA